MNWRDLLQLVGHPCDFPGVMRLLLEALRAEAKSQRSSVPESAAPRGGGDPGALRRLERRPGQPLTSVTRGSHLRALV